MMKHIILKKDRYAKVINGEMTTWLTLNDDYAKSLNVGEIVRIVNDNPPDNAQEGCYARVTGYYVYGSFDELYKKVNKNELGYGQEDDKKNIELIKSQMYLQCTPESEKQYGVRGIKLEYLPDYKELEDMTEGEAQAYLHGMVKGVQKARKQLFRTLEKTDGMTVGIARFIQGNPELYFAGICETENDMLKYLLSENIKNAQALLDTIQEYEDKTGFPVVKKILKILPLTNS
jgi:ASC-1-like (ASCH) protein